MAKHELKILPENIEAVVDGSKTFEIRKNDRKIFQLETPSFSMNLMV